MAKSADKASRRSVAGCAARLIVIQTLPTDGTISLPGSGAVAAGQTLTVGFSVACADPEARRRIAYYLTDVALELELA